MTIAFEPGEEIRANVDSKTEFYAKALSWREQRRFIAQVEELKKLETEEAQTDAALQAISERVTRTVPAMEIAPDTLSNVLDYKHIWNLLAALEFNLSHDEKKT